MSGYRLQLAAQVPSGGVWECFPCSPELELLFPGSSVFHFLSLLLFLWRMYPVAPGAIRWWIWNILLRILHI